MDIKVELDKLTKNIYIPMVFYIPYDLFPGISEESKKNFDELKFFNTMAILTINEETKELENSTYGFQILRKTDILKSNYIQLIELKNRLSKETFFHILDEYLNLANAYNYAYTWMVNHIEKDVPHVRDDYKNYYIYQADALNNHIEEINTKFSLSNDLIVSSVDFNKIFENGKGLPKLDVELKTALLQPIKTPTPPKKVKKKTILPSDDEVDNMLLEQVFNVTLSQKL